jgi:hypothetical protein
VTQLRKVVCVILAVVNSERVRALRCDCGIYRSEPRRRLCLQRFQWSDNEEAANESHAGISNCPLDSP